MKRIILLCAGCLFFQVRLFAQAAVQDNAVTHQEQRMVFQQWDQNKFDPKPGFLSLNPYYWLVWGLFYPNYHKTDLRPLSVNGPQTQRLALVNEQEHIDNKYELQSDTLKNSAYSQLYANLGQLSDADPLWFLYYNQQFQPLLNYSMTSLLGPLSPQVSAKLIAEGTYAWYTNELGILRERLQGARTTDMDRGSRIMAYYRLLKEYRTLSGVWSIRIAAAGKDMSLTARQQQLRAGEVSPGAWTPQTDIQIAHQVLLHAKY